MVGELGPLRSRRGEGGGGGVLTDITKRGMGEKWETVHE